MTPSWDAADYASHSRGQFGWALSVIDRLDLRGDETVLDVGCGDGKVSATIAERLPSGRVVGVDSSPAMIDLARRTWAHRSPALTFFQCDAQALVVPGTFDLAFSNAAIHWMPDHHAVVTGLSRAIGPGGRMFLSMGGRGTASPVREALARLASAGPWATYLAGARSPHYFRGPEDFEPPLARAGFRVTRIELVAKPMRHADRAALTGWLRTTWMTYTERCPEQQRGDFLAALTDLVAPACDLAEDGALMMPMVNLEIEAVKQMR